jgi:hypothetical protein
MLAPRHQQGTLVYRLRNLGGITPQEKIDAARDNPEAN